MNATKLAKCQSSLDKLWKIWAFILGNERKAMLELTFSSKNTNNKAKHSMTF
jgi:hypothetical protein